MKYSKMKIYGRSMTSMEKRDLKIIKEANMRAGATTVTISVRLMLLVRSVLSPPFLCWDLNCLQTRSLFFLIQVKKKKLVLFCCLIYIYIYSSHMSL